MRDDFYRVLVSPSYVEEELWARLDAALEASLVDERMAWSLAWSTVSDAVNLGFREVAESAAQVLEVMSGVSSGWFTMFRPA